MLGVLPPAEISKQTLNSSRPDTTLNAPHLIQNMKTLSYRDVILKEKEQLLLRRQKLNIQHGTPGQENWFGIALSGGGIRSATINLGILKTLNRFGILKKADYLSSVSGGGYTHAYVQATAKEVGSLDQLFNDKHIADMRQHGEYLTPGTGIWKLGNTFLLLVAVVISWCMSILSPLILGGMAYFAYGILEGLIGTNPLSGTGTLAEQFAQLILYVTGGIFVVHFVINIYLNYNLGVSKLFNRVESILVGLAIVVYAWLMVSGITGIERNTDGILLALLKMTTLFVLGF